MFINTPSFIKTIATKVLEAVITIFHALSSPTEEKSSIEYSSKDFIKNL